MATISMQILPGTSITITDGNIVIDGAVDGTIEVIGTPVSVVTFSGEGASFDGGIITFGDAL